MIEYQIIVPASGDYLVAYPTPGAANVITVAGTARTKQGAEQECARLNAASRKAEAEIQADMLARGIISLDREN